MSLTYRCNVVTPCSSVRGNRAQDELRLAGNGGGTGSIGVRFGNVRYVAEHTNIRKCELRKAMHAEAGNAHVIWSGAPTLSARER